LAARKAELERSLSTTKWSATGQAQLDSILSAAKKDGVALDAKLVSQAQTTIKTAVDKIAADKAIAAKAAAAKAATDKAAAQKTAEAARQKAIADAELKAQQQQQARDKAAADAKLAADYQKQLNSADTSKQIQDVLNRAKTAGVTLDSTTVKMATDRSKNLDFNASLETAKSLDEVKALVAQADQAKLGYDQGRVRGALARFDIAPVQKAAPPPVLTKEQQAAAMNEYGPKLVAAKTQAELDALVKQATDQGVILNQGFVDRARTGVQQQEARATQEALQAKTQQFNTQINTAADQAGIDTIVKQAQDAGIEIAPAVIQQRQAVFKQQQAAADFVNKLGPATGFVNKFGPGGQEFVSRADDPITGEKGGWYQVVGNGLQAVGQDGRPTGAVIPADVFNEQQRTSQGNYTTYATEQKKAADAKAMQEHNVWFV
jgi:hypothetical protein